MEFRSSGISGVSIILCCFNSAKRLPETLKHIAQQKVDKSLSWEVIVVNNNSTDATYELAASLWKSIEIDTELKVVHEATPGLSNARAKGMQYAKHDIILWCDDDNWLCDTYVQTAYDLMTKNENIGALGGWCEAAFEIEKPDWFDSCARYFAVSKQGKKSGDITSKKGCVYGAGMVLRKSHWEQLNTLGFKHLLGDRVGKSLSSGGDTEYCYALRLLGYKMWFDERLYFTHFMTKERLSLAYVSRIRKAMSYSNFMIWPYLDKLGGLNPRTRQDFIREAFKGMPMRLIKKTGALVIGNFEQKEVAKRYLRHLKYRLFYHSTYKRNLETINTWLSNHT